jgi:hypothetical protein
MTIRIIKKHPVLKKRTTVILIKVKSCNAFLRMLLVYNSCYLKPTQRYNFLILDIYHLSVYLRGQECEHPLLFFEAKRYPRPRKLGKHCLKGTRGYRELKDDAIDLTLRRTVFGRGFGPVLRQTT